MSTRDSTISNRNASLRVSSQRRSFLSQHDILKFWIQRDGTEAGIAYVLIAAGVPKSDIVIGYRSLYMRKFTELAIG